MPTIRNKDVSIYYEIQGDGPVIVFHTGAGGDHRIWDYAGYTDGLPGFRKILMDQRGRGKSSRPASAEDHRLQCYAEDIAAVLDDAGSESAGFWGYSDGAIVGIAFGAYYPKRMKALVGSGGIPFLDLCDLPPIADEAAFIREIVARGGVRHELEGFMDRENDHFPEPIDLNIRDGDPLMNALDEIAWRSWRGPKSIYGTMSAPVLMITGEKEDKNHQTEKSVAAMPNARMVRIPGVGHLANFYRGDLSRSRALQFFQENLV